MVRCYCLHAPTLLVELPFPSPVVHPHARFHAVKSVWSSLPKKTATARLVAPLDAFPANVNFHLPCIVESPVWILPPRPSYWVIPWQGSTFLFLICQRPVRRRSRSVFHHVWEFYSICVVGTHSSSRFLKWLVAPPAFFPENKCLSMLATTRRL